MYGIRFILVNGDVEHYDPVKKEDFEDTETHYIFSNGYYTYDLEKEVVSSIEWYDLCEKCSHELYKGRCENYNCSEYEGNSI